MAQPPLPQKGNSRMTHTPDKIDPARRAFLLGRIEQILRTADLQAPDDFFENIQASPLDRLAHFFAQFTPADFRQLSYGDGELVEEWLYFRCGLTEGHPQVTIPQHSADNRIVPIGTSEAIPVHDWREAK